MASSQRPSPDSHRRSLGAALGEDHTLRDLLARVRESQARLAAITPLMDPALRAAVQAGPLDEQTWVLLAAHSAAAAKLRQLAPVFEAALQAQGRGGPAIKVKVAQRS
ncbi:conserved hypothetical protein [Rubrivivax sp. A210]|uniref:hypothetical protein n=1 Tax=Rubrivivax sp. A210 TaxID=2772301 RepID=UPI001917AE2F|nr:hypothetical protein [Rubrivivax sp. A210]CAD5369232.1 conserved hypothetical protein [Rubrivivax sp. A210]